LNRILFLILTILIHCNILYSISLSNYIRRVWTTEDGLPQNSIQDIVQTKDGYLWAGTQLGLVRYDGNNFKTFDTSNVNEFKSSYITKLYPDHKKGLWIGTNNGLLFYNNGKFKRIELINSKSNFVSALYQDIQGRIWIGTHGGGIYILKENTITTYSEKEHFLGNTVNSFCEDFEENMWVGTGDGVVVIDKKIDVFNVKKKFPDTVVNVIHKDHNNNMWIGTWGKGVFFVNHDTLKYNHLEGISDKKILSIFEDKKHKLWIGTNNGVYLVGNSGKVQHKIENALPDKIISSIYEDKESNLWMGTDGDGLNMFRRGKFDTYTVNEGLSNNLVWSIYEDRDRKVWIGTQKGLSVIENDKVRKIGFLDSIITTIHEDRNGVLWIATYGDGLYSIKDNNITTHTTKDGLSNSIITSIYEDDQGALWIGTWDGGLNILKDGKFSRLFPGNDLLSKIRFIYESKDRTKWFGTDKGLLSLKERIFKLYSTEDGLSDNTILSLYEDENGFFWIGTKNGGLNLLDKDKGKITSFASSNGLLDNTIYAITEDSGNLWMTSNKGVFYINRDYLLKTEHPVNQLTYTSFGIKDGLKSRECNGGFQPSVWKSKNGRIWFSTVKGVASIDPGNMRINKVMPPVLIDSVRIDSKNVDMKNEISISASSKKLEIHYKGLSYVDPQRMNFRYILEGYDSGWSHVQNERTTYYTNLPPGKYTFKVTAANNDGIWNQTPATFSFSKLPHLYETLWFRIVSAIVSAVILFLLHRIIVQRLKSQKKRLAELIEMKAKALIKKEKDLDEKKEQLEEQSDEIDEINRELNLKYEYNGLDESELTYYKKYVEDFLMKEKSYINPEISLRTLAEKLSISTNHLSQIINACFDQNFHTFINSYRVEEVKKMFADPNKQDESILSIAFEAGFKSKSTFNTFFKKKTGVTPSSYRQGLVERLKESP